MKRLRVLAVIAITACALLFVAHTQAKPPDGLPPTTDSLLARCAALEAAVAELQGRLAAEEADMSNMQIDISGLQDDVVPGLADYVTVVDGSLNGLSGPHVIFEGVNVHVRNSSGSTDTVPDGLGNLLVGYNEPRLDEYGNPDESERTGSHNLIIGPYHKYSGIGGFVAGLQNTISADYCSVSGGWNNGARGLLSSVSGGYGNSASGKLSSVSGGNGNTALGRISAISGGWDNSTHGDWSTVSGGAYNSAHDESSTVSGGFRNIAACRGSTVSGGQNITTTLQFEHLP